nr:hypothetical protein [Sphingomonas bacterium]
MLGIVVSGEFERLDRSGYGDGGRRNHNLFDEASRIALADVAVVRAQFRKHDFSEPIDRFGRNSSISRRKLTLDQNDLLFEVRAPGALVGEACREIGVARADDPLLDEVEHVLDRAFDPRAFGSKRFEMRLTFAHGGRTLIEQAGKQHAKALGPQKAIGKRVDHDRLERVIAHADARTCRLAAAKPSRAAVVAVATAFARRDGQGVAAFGVPALRDARKHRRAGYKARRRDLPRVADDTGLHLQPLRFEDDRRHSDLLPLILRPLHTVADVMDAVVVDPRHRG